jgi:hypothetical protein
MLSLSKHAGIPLIDLDFSHATITVAGANPANAGAFA